MLEHNYAMIRKHLGYPVLPVTNEHIERLRDAHALLVNRRTVAEQMV